MFAFHILGLQQYACISGFLTCFFLGTGKQKTLQRTPLKSDPRYNDFKGQTHCSKGFFTCILITVTLCWKVWLVRELQYRHGWNKQVLVWIYFVLAETPPTNAGCYKLYWTGRYTRGCFFPVSLQCVVTVYRLLIAVLRTIEVSSICAVPQKSILNLLHRAQYYVNSL